MDREYEALRATVALTAGLILGCLVSASAPSSAQESSIQPPKEFDQAQTNAVRQLRQLSALRVDLKGIPSYIKADLGVFRDAEATRAGDAAALLRSLALLLRMDGSESLQIRRSSRDSLGTRHHRMRQFIDGLEVIGGEVILHVDERTSRVKGLDAQFLPGTGVPRTPAVSGPESILFVLKQRIGAADGQLSTSPRLAFARTADAGGFLVWAALVRYKDDKGQLQIDELLVDATTGDFVQRIPKVYEALNRQVNHYQTGELLISEGGSTSDYRCAERVYILRKHL